MCKPGGVSAVTSIPDIDIEIECSDLTVDRKHQIEMELCNILLTFIGDLMTLLHLLIAALLHRDIGALGASVGGLTLLLVDRAADRLRLVVAHLVVLGVADTLGNLAALVLVLGLVPKVFVEFFHFAFFY